MPTTSRTQPYIMLYKSLKRKEKEQESETGIALKQTSISHSNLLKEEGEAENHEDDQHEKI